MYLFVVLFLASAVVTAGARVYLVRRGVMDRPNLRSSHAMPVPRGGGLSIVLVFLSAVAWLVAKHAAPADLGLALVGGGIAIGVVGFLDDRFRLAPWPRLVVHILAAGWAVWCLNAAHPVQLRDRGDFLAWIGLGGVLVGLVWLTNLFNFMDGIDGLAGMEAACVSGLGAILLLRNGSPDYAQVAGALAAASLGFLVWNWPPAKIFMGDVGSGFLGFTLGVLAIFSSKAHPELIWPWLILPAAFLVDATVTLLRRMFSRARWYEAHRSHAYQHAARAWGNHASVTLAIAGINIGWLFPLAWAAYRYPQAAPALAAVAFAPLVYLAFRFDGGREKRPSDVGVQDSIAR